MPWSRSEYLVSRRLTILREWLTRRYPTSSIAEKKVS